MPRKSTVMVEVAPGELIDKITILEIKSERMTDELRLVNVRVELETLNEARSGAMEPSAALDELTAALKAVNERLWEIEDDIRACERAKDFGPRFVELARSVYLTNDRRAAIKRDINELLGSRLIEEKSYEDYRGDRTLQPGSTRSSRAPDACTPPRTHERMNNDESIFETGGAGTILFGGSGLLGPYILEMCPEMISVGRSRPPTDNRHIHVDDLGDLSALEDVEFDRVIYIIGNTHHAAMNRERLDPDVPSAFDYHPLPFIRTMEQLKHRGIRKLIHFSTLLVYDPERLPDPVSEDAPIAPYRNRYVFSKYLVEEASKFYENWIPTITGRFCNLYGPVHDRHYETPRDDRHPLPQHDLIPVLTRELAEHGRAEIWNDTPARDFLYVTDAAEAVLKLLDSDYTGLVNLGTGVATRVSEVVEAAREITGLPVEVEGRPVSGPMFFRSDTTRLKSIIDWEPKVSARRGVELCWESAQRWVGHARWR